MIYDLRFQIIVNLSEALKNLSEAQATRAMSNTVDCMEKCGILLEKFIDEEIRKFNKNDAFLGSESND